MPSSIIVLPGIGVATGAHELDRIMARIRRGGGDLVVQQSLDSYFVCNWSLWPDIRSLFRTGPGRARATRVRLVLLQASPGTRSLGDHHSKAGDCLLQAAPPGVAAHRVC